MYVERFGTGKRIYLGLHGWGGDRKTWAPLAQYVPPDTTFYCADLPGVSMSAPPNDWQVDEIVAEIVGTISSIGDPGVTIVGHCGGAVFGLLAAMRAGHLVERLVMIDPFTYLPRYFKVFINENFGNRAYNATFANAFGRWITNQALRGHRRGNADLTASFSAANHEVNLNYLKLFAEMEKIAIPRDLTVGTDLITGERSFGAVRRSVAALEKQLPNVRVFRLAGAAHLPVEEAPEELSGIIFMKPAA